MSIIYNQGKANGVVDALIRLSMYSNNYVEEEKEFAKDMHRLA